MRNDMDTYEENHLRILIENMVREGRTQSQIERALAETTGDSGHAIELVRPAQAFIRRAAIRLGLAA